MNTNTVEIIGYYGGDVTHACSAWTSTNRELSSEKLDRLPKLLKYLAEHRHETPFEKSALHFLVTTDMATHIHFLKHRIGVSLNSESARYKEVKEDNFYIPDDWSLEWQDKLKTYTKQGLKLYHECVEGLVAIGLDRKRAKESARFFRAYSTQYQADVMFNWRSFYHFQSLRNKPEAQREIRLLAQEMLELVRNIEGQPFKYTLDAFGL